MLYFLEVSVVLSPLSPWVAILTRLEADLSSSCPACPVCPEQTVIVVDTAALEPTFEGKYVISAELVGEATRRPGRDLELELEEITESTQLATATSLSFFLLIDEEGKELKLEESRLVALPPADGCVGRAVGSYREVFSNIGIVYAPSVSAKVVFIPSRK